MKVVVDTNVLISAILKDRIPEEIILYITSEPGISWVANAEILDEYRNVLQRPKFSLPPNLIQAWFTIFDTQINLVTDSAESISLKDPDDEMFLRCSVSANADVLISGDRVLKQVMKLGKTLIMSPAQFKEYIIP